MKFCIFIGFMCLIPTATLAQEEENPKQNPIFDPNEPLPLEIKMKSPERAIKTPITEHWYGWQILTSGGISLIVSLASVGVSMSSGANEVMEVGIPLGGIGYFLGGPIIHWAHSSAWKGFASLGINIVSPGLTGLIGLGLGSESDDVGTAIGLMFGGVILGGVGAILFDSYWLAYEPAPTPEGSSFQMKLAVGTNGLSIIGQF